MNSKNETNEENPIDINAEFWKSFDKNFPKSSWAKETDKQVYEYLTGKKKP